MTELLACPFCGGKAVRYENPVSDYAIECEDCHCTTPLCNSEDLAFSFWNTREQTAKELLLERVLKVLGYPS